MTQHFRDRRRSGSSRRQTPSRSENTTILIVCEGRETEHNYFDKLKREEYARKHFTVTVKRGKGGSRLEIAQSAINQKNLAGDNGDNFDEVWCVMDVEHPETQDEMRQAFALLKKNDINAALSNPAIEVWFLAHFEKTGVILLNGDAAKGRLDRHWQSHFHIAYDKADGQIYYRIANRTDDAIANAKWVREEHHHSEDVVACNSSTNVDLLVGKLRGE
jgi:hypothetical protein